MAPRPGAFAELVDGDTRQTLRILRARAAERTASPPSAAPGTIVRGDGPDTPALRVATGSGWLVPLEVQREGKKAMPVDAFLRGHALGEDAHFDAKSPAPAAERPS
jgi:methionyl-tRNA formyltransferase